MGLRRPISIGAQIAYCERRLSDPEIHPADRRAIERKLAVLTNRCRACGRPVQPHLLVDGLGPSCARKESA